MPACVLHDDGEVLAFMDIGPVVKGHALVIPRAHYQDLLETPDEVLKKLITVAAALARAQKSALAADGINIHQSNGRPAGQVVNHVHFHVIPRFKDDGHRWNWNAGRYSGMPEMQALAGKIKEALAPRAAPPSS